MATFKAKLDRMLADQVTDRERQERSTTKAKSREEEKVQRFQQLVDEELKPRLDESAVVLRSRGFECTIIEGDKVVDSKLASLKPALRFSVRPNGVGGNDFDLPHLDFTLRGGTVVIEHFHGVGKATKQTYAKSEFGPDKIDADILAFVRRVLG